MPAEACSADAHVRARATEKAAPAVTGCAGAAAQDGEQECGRQQESQTGQQGHAGRPLTVSGNAETSSAVPGDVPFS